MIILLKLIIEPERHKSHDAQMLLKERCSYTYLYNCKLEMCKLLLDHFDSVFTTPDPSKITHDPKTFFVEPPVLDASCLTDKNFSETVIIDAIKELSPNSAAGPDGIRYTSHTTD